MAGAIAHHAKVARGRDQPLAKVGLPDPVDDHPRHQWVIRGWSASGPARACGPVDLARRAGRLEAAAGQDRRHARLDDGARPGGIASLERASPGPSGPIHSRYKHAAAPGAGPP